MKIIICSLPLLLLVGCGTPTKMGLSYEDEVLAGKHLAAINVCHTKGWMDLSTAARGKGIIESYLNRHDYVKSTVEQAYKDTLSEEITKSDCSTIAINIQGKVNQIEANNREVDRQRESFQRGIDSINNAVNARKPISTNCYKFGTQVMCSSY